MTESRVAQDSRPAGGAVEQLARDDVERNNFLEMAGKGIGAGAAATSLALGSQFCAKAIASGLFKGKDLSVIRTFGAEEAAHVAALHGVVRIKRKEVIAAALSIHSIEAVTRPRSTSCIRNTPTPTGAFAKPASMSQVLAAVKPFIA